MNAFRSSLLLAVCVGLVATPAAFAKTTTIKVRSDSISFRTNDIGPKGASKGDTIFYRDRLVNVVAQFGHKKGARVGSDTGKLTFTGAHTATFTGTVNLPGGTMKLSGTVLTTTTHEVVIQVVSGTGAFAGLRGTLTVGNGRDHVLNTYRLTKKQPTLPVA
jgi:hypothetical protein